MKPIIFSTPMVKAILDGKKTMTRRIIKKDLPGAPSGKIPCYKLESRKYGVASEDEDIPCYYHPGQILWVRETWAEVGSFDPGLIIYRADYPECVPAKYENIPDISEIKWKPSIHIRREHARIFLEVKEIYAERLQDITEDDCKAEGLSGKGLKYQFAKLWNDLNDKRGYGWFKRPWVWVIKFSVKEIKTKVA